MRFTARRDYEGREGGLGGGGGHLKLFLVQSTTDLAELMALLERRLL